MRRLAERSAELTAEVSARQAGDAGHVVDPERLGVPGVGEVLGPGQVANRRDAGHAASMPAVIVAAIEIAGGADGPASRLSLR